MTASAEKRRILIIEDDPGHADLILRHLSDAPEYEPVLASTIREAGALCDEHPPELILTDYRLPDGDGGAILGFIRDRCPVVMMTSQGNEQIAVEIMKAGVADYVVKTPETFESLPRIIDRALREWELRISHRRSEEALRASEEHYRSLFEQAPDGIVYLTADMEILAFNETFALMHGFSMHEMRFLAISDIDTANPFDDETHRKRMGKILSGERVVFEVEHLHRNGHTISLEVMASLVRFGGATRIVAFHRDISERRRAQEQQALIAQQLEQAQRLESLGVLAGGIAHDFNNLLMVVLGHVNMLQMAVAPASPLQHHLQQIDTAGQRAAELCSQMLSYAGKSPRNHEPVHLQQIAADMANLLKTSVSKKAVLTLNLPPTLPPILADPSQIRQIIMNLIINASEALGESDGSILVAAEAITVTHADRPISYFGAPIPDGTYIRLDVADTGCGMTAAVQAKIFEPFYTTKFTGRGLGMSAVLGIVNAHRAYLGLHSIPGSGTTFSLFFPAAGDAEQVQGPPDEHAGTFAAPSASVLLVDDEEMLRDVGRSLLESLGCRVVTASDGREALDLYTASPDAFDLVILDMSMPKMDGAETFRALRRHDPEARIILSSGFGENDVTAVLFREGLAGFIHKPYSRNRMYRVLADTLSRATALRSS
jgi:PAS domain S-box-containing protein